MSIRLFTMYLKVPIILLAMVEASLLLFAPYFSGAVMYQDHDFDAVTRTGYVPNLMAGGLASNRSRLVAALVPAIAGSVFLDTVQSLTDTL